MGDAHLADLIARVEAVLTMAGGYPPPALGFRCELHVSRTDRGSITMALDTADLRAILAALRARGAGANA